MSLVVNPDYTEATGPQPGTYAAKIKKVEQRLSKEGGNPYLNWTLEVDTGYSKPMTTFYSTPFTGRGAGLFKNLVKAAFDPNYESGPFNADLLIDCSVQVNLEKLPGDKYLRVVEVNPLPARAGSKEVENW